MVSCIDACRESEIGLFLGAGASLFAKYPLMEELTEKVLPRVDDKRVSSAISRLGKTCDIEVLLDHLDWIFEIVEYLSSDEGLRTALKLEDLAAENINSANNEYRRAIEAIRMEIFNVLDSIELDIGKCNGVYNAFFSSIYEAIGCISNNRVIPILTTNYDCIIEDIEGHTQLANIVHDGWIHNPGERREGIYAHLDEIPAPKDEKWVAILKLHGSLRWYYRKDNPKKMKYEREVDAIRSDTYLPMVIPPKSRKAREYSSHDYYEKIFRNAEIVLSTIKVLIIIGYSFRDSAINEMFKKCIANNTNLRFIVIDPNREYLENRLFKAFGILSEGRFTHIRQSFDAKEKYRHELNEALRKMLNGGS